MLTQVHRQKKVKFKIEKILQTLKERGSIFAGESTAEKVKECLLAIKTPEIGVFLEDKRQDVQSSHVCVFITSNGGIAALPCSVSDDHIIWHTVKDVEKDHNPYWFIQGYNEIAKTRGMPAIEYVPIVRGPPPEKRETKPL